MRHLPRRIYGLQRYRARSQESQRNGRSVERRSSGQYSGNTLVVQRRKRINQNGLTYGRLSDVMILPLGIFRVRSIALARTGVVQAQ